MGYTTGWASFGDAHAEQFAFDGTDCAEDSAKEIGNRYNIPTCDHSVCTATNGPCGPPVPGGAECCQVTQLLNCYADGVLTQAQVGGDCRVDVGVEPGITGCVESGGNDTDCEDFAFPNVCQEGWGGIPAPLGHMTARPTRWGLPGGPRGAPRAHRRPSGNGLAGHERPHGSWVRRSKGLRQGVQACANIVPMVSLNEIDLLAFNLGLQAGQRIAAARGPAPLRSAPRSRKPRRPIAKVELTRKKPSKTSAPRVAKRKPAPEVAPKRVKAFAAGGPLSQCSFGTCSRAPTRDGFCWFHALAKNRR